MINLKKSIYILIIILVISTLFGCINNLTPKKRAEEFFNMYIENNKDVMLELDNFIQKQELNNNQKDLYKSIIRNNYTNLKYKILSEKISDKKAVVTANIKVKDLYTIEKDTIKYLGENPADFYTDGKFNQNKFINYKLEEMKKRTDEVKYNVRLNMIKKSNVWFIKELDDKTLQKIHGTYKHS